MCGSMCCHIISFPRCLLLPRSSSFWIALFVRITCNCSPRFHATDWVEFISSDCQTSSSFVYECAVTFQSWLPLVTFSYKSWIAIQADCIEATCISVIFTFKIYSLSAVLLPRTVHAMIVWENAKGFTLAPQTFYKNSSLQLFTETRQMTEKKRTRLWSLWYGTCSSLDLDQIDVVWNIYCFLPGRGKQARMRLECGQCFRGNLSTTEIKLTQVWFRWRMKQIADFEGLFETAPRLIHWNIRRAVHQKQPL